jgi:hypothetical protein
MEPYHARFKIQRPQYHLPCDGYTTFYAEPVYRMHRFKRVKVTSPPELNNFLQHNPYAVMPPPTRARRFYSQHNQNSSDEIK